MGLLTFDELAGFAGWWDWFTGGEEETRRRAEETRRGHMRLRAEQIKAKRRADEVIRQARVREKKATEKRIRAWWDVMEARRRAYEGQGGDPFGEQREYAVRRQKRRWQAYPGVLTPEEKKDLRTPRKPLAVTKLAKGRGTWTGGAPVAQRPPVRGPVFGSGGSSAPTAFQAAGIAPRWS